MSRVLHLNLDDAWTPGTADLPVCDARDWGKSLRFSAPSYLIESFYRDYSSKLAPFILYGSGDFHHLTALWLRRVTEPVVLVSLDNHPDWDIRPPRWACGGWINRALELPQVHEVSVWGCGNFECWWPGQIFGNRRAERQGRLRVHPWADGRARKDKARAGAIVQTDWKEKFLRFAESNAGKAIYVTIDLDCLRAEDAVTNWENGRYTLADLVWALEILRGDCRIAAGDICGAYSPPHYARRTQKFAATMDHPKLGDRDPGEARRINETALRALWPALTQ